MQGYQKLVLNPKHSLDTKATLMWLIIFNAQSSAELYSARIPLCSKVKTYFDTSRREIWQLNHNSWTQMIPFTLVKKSVLQCICLNFVVFHSSQQRIFFKYIQGECALAFCCAWCIAIFEGLVILVSYIQMVCRSPKCVSRFCSIAFHLAVFFKMQEHIICECISVDLEAINKK